MRNPEGVRCLQREETGSPLHQMLRLLTEEAASAPEGKIQTQKGRAPGKVRHSEPPRWRQIQERPVIQGLEPSLRYGLGTGGRGVGKGQDHWEERDASGGAEHHHTPLHIHNVTQGVGSALRMTARWEGGYTGY